MFGTTPSSAETLKNEGVGIVHEMDYVAPLHGVVSIELEDEPAPPDPDRHAGFDLPNYDLWVNEVNKCEANGRWDTKYKYGTTTLSKYRGGLQIETPDLWDYLGGQEFAPTPDKATAEQQMWKAELWLRENGPGSWPECADGLQFNFRPLRPFEPSPPPEPNKDDALSRNLQSYRPASERGQVIPEVAPKYMAVRSFVMERTIDGDGAGIDTAAVSTETADRGVAFQEAPLPKAYLWQTELDATYNARQCIADYESRHAGMYTAEYGGTPSDKDGSDASGISQWLNSAWRFYVPLTEAFYNLHLTSPEEEAAGARLHAAYAPPFVQDLVTAFALLHPELAQNQKPWTHPTCYLIIGTDKQLRPDGPENGPTPYVQAQIK